MALLIVNLDKIGSAQAFRDTFKEQLPDLPIRMAYESESLKLAWVMVDAIQRQIGLNCACSHKSAMGEMPTPEELAELHAAIGISQTARNAFIDHHENVSAPLATPAATA